MTDAQQVKGAGSKIGYDYEADANMFFKYANGIALGNAHNYTISLHRAVLRQDSFDMWLRQTD